MTLKTVTTRLFCKPEQVAEAVKKDKEIWCNIRHGKSFYSMTKEEKLRFLNGETKQDGREGGE